MGVPVHAVTAEQLVLHDNLTLTLESWAEGGSYLNLDGKQGVFDFGPTDANSAQEVHLNQLYLSSAIQLALQDHDSIGFTLDNLIGTDWNNSYSYGFLDRAFRWNQIGWDLPQAYFSFSSQKEEASVLELDVGKIFTPYGYEDVRSTERPLYSTGYLYNFIYPTTQTGISLEWQFIEGVKLYQAVTNAPDISASYLLRPNYLAGVSYESQAELPTGLSLYVSYGEGLMRMATVMQSGVPFMPMDFDSFAKPELGTVLIISELIEQALSKDLSLTLDLTQGSFGHARTLYDHLPGTSGTWFGAGMWLQHQNLTKDLKGVFRFEVLYNSNGVATGYGGTFIESTLGIAYSPWEKLTFRPELRYDRAFGATPYLNATTAQQFSLNVDGIFRF
jgi:Putative beta-barrel porin-2, OmpL-like. bbp2